MLDECVGGPEKYWRFQKFDRLKYTEVNDSLKKLTHLTAREWAIARLCADFKSNGRSQMTWIGENLPDLVPFMNEKYARQDVSSAEAAFKRKVVRSGTTFFYAYYAGLISIEEMLEMVQGIITNIEELKRIEGSEVSDSGEETSTDVQVLMAETLRRITDRLKDGK
ncbi:MAG TPA: DUF5806 family protein [Methanocella sp.]|nr:DUF5806 family protein [Methanocella sp.]